MIETLVSDYLTELAEMFTSPRKRVFVGYLVAALLIGMLWLRWRFGSGWLSGCRQMLSPAIWWSSSARADYQILLLNRLLMMLISPLLLSQVVLATLIYQQLHGLIGNPPLPGSLLPDWSVMTAFTLFFFLLDDFARYFLHMLMHRWPWLWAFHKVHHSARTMTPLTVLRTHPVEGVLFALRSVLVQAISIGLFLFFFGSQVDLITVLGVNVLVFTFNVTGANLRHSHVAIGYWKPLERILISPAQHQIHHSVEPRHYDKNFGAVLAVWDWLGGSLHLSERDTPLCFGLAANVVEGEQSLKQLYLAPFTESYQALRSAGRHWLRRAARGAVRMR
ncbi:sterol desaturase family protein [Marinobacterium arenosum]|uniref:sterol desaturase family protein n=1 Tax=Marinobacterium arenosum TaxID=2862496 RepID=UPI001C987C9E|nr:sterol desaturase family protein [Marinobacterium arenosum]MBY4677838.1 sterol desaturase family protein [Marinobacterium arenosum]